MSETKKFVGEYTERLKRLDQFMDRYPKIITAMDIASNVSILLNSFMLEKREAKRLFKEIESLVQKLDFN